MNIIDRLRMGNGTLVESLSGPVERVDRPNFTATLHDNLGTEPPWQTKFKINELPIRSRRKIKPGEIVVWEVHEYTTRNGVVKEISKVSLLKAPPITEADREVGREFAKRVRRYSRPPNL